MPMNILVLHGPNLNLLGERPGDAPGQTLEVLNRRIREKALALGMEVKLVQSNHEGALVDALHAERKWAQGVLVAPGAMARGAYALGEALRAVGKPAVEVHLDDYRDEEGERRRSALKEAVAGRVFGKGFESYLVGLERFATGELDGGKKRRAEARAKVVAKPAPKPKPFAGLVRAQPEARKSLGRQPEAPPEGGRKSLGRADKPAAREEKKALGAVVGKPVAKGLEKSLGRKGKDREPAAGVLSRALVRQKIEERLAGRLSPAELAAWAKAQWMEVQRGAPAEGDHRELLEDSLQTLVVSAAMKLTDDQLVELMLRLDR